MDTLYLWIKVLHVVAVISWMAGLLYLPRLFVYHSAEVHSDALNTTFKTMEWRLLKYIMRPAMTIVWVTGLFMAYYSVFYLQTWFLVKLLFVVLLTGCHIFMSRIVTDFAHDRNARPQRFFRWLNEAPTVLMIGIVSMVIVRPF